MTYENDPRRPIPNGRRFSSNDNTKWGLGAFALVALLIVGGFMFYNSTDRTHTASTNAPTATQSTSVPNAQSTPSPQVGKTAPPPAKTQ